MRGLGATVSLLLVVAACGGNTGDASTSTTPLTTGAVESTTTEPATTTTAGSTTTALPGQTTIVHSTTTFPESTTSSTTSEPLVFCTDLAAAGDSFAEAVSWWLGHGAPDRMDADLDGLPCESVYPAEDVAAFIAELSPVTTGEPFPPSLPRELIPWAQVGRGWYLTPFHGSDAWGLAPPLAERPTVLYLLNDRGAVYEVAAWDGGVGVDVLDWRPDGSMALVRLERYSEAAGLVIEIYLLDVAAGTSDFVERVPLDSLEYPMDLRYEFTRPTGRNLIRLAETQFVAPGEPYDDQPSAYELSRVTIDGRKLATVFELEASVDEWWIGVSWLYHHDGGSIFVSDGETLQEVSNTGQPIRELWTPVDLRCNPVRWWDISTIVAACTSGNPDLLPHEFYSQIWLLDLAGGPGRALTQPPDEEIENIGQYFGSYDASPTLEGALVSDGADCGGGGLSLVAEDGTFIRSIPGGSLVGHSDGVAVTKAWEACDGTPASLYAVSLDDGSVVRTLIGAGDPIFGATGQSQSLDPFVP